MTKKPTQVRNCDKCGLSEFELMGFLPAEVVTGEKSSAWINASMCKECGIISPMPIKEADLERSDDRVLMAMDRNGLLPEDVAEELL